MKGQGISTIFRTIIGLLLLFFFILPFNTLDVDTKDIKYVLSAYEWLLSTFIVLSISFALCLVFRKQILGLQSLKFNNKIFLVTMISATAALSHYLGYYCFRFRPHVIDAIVQLWQAKLFAAGKLVSHYEGPISFFVSQHMLFEEGKIYSQYSPGNSMFLLINFITKLPNPSAIIACIITMLCSYRFCRRVYSESSANVSLLLYFSCTFFLVNNQSFMNHVPGLAFAAVFLDFYSLWLGSKKYSYLALTGMSLGILFVCRSLEGLFLVAVFGTMHFSEFLNPKLLKCSLLNSMIFSISFATIASAYFAFNHFTTGNAFLPGFIKLWGEGHNLGFHESPWGQQHNLLRGLDAFYINLKLLNEFLFESPIPPLSLLGLYFLIKRIDISAWDYKLLALSIGIPFLYVFYWHRDSFLGPRYTYIALAFLIPLLSNAFYSLYAAANNVYAFGQSKSFKPLSIRNLYLFTLFISLIYVFSVGLPMRTGLYSTFLASMKQDFKKLPEVKEIKSGIIFVKVSWGTRMIASLREMGISASLTEKAYRSIDHCDLWALIKKSRDTLGSKALVEERLTMLIAQKQDLFKVNLNRDPTLKLKTETLNNLPAVCKEELDYDSEGYGILEPHFLENSPDLQGPLVVARDMKEQNYKLAKYYGSIKDFYLWFPGKLQKIPLS